MASNGSRKRRHKSKEKLQAVTQPTEEIPDNDQMPHQGPVPTPEQQEAQQQEPGSTPEQQQPQGSLGQPDQLDNGSELITVAGRPQLASILDRLFFSRPPEMTGAATCEEEMSRVACLSVAASIGHVEGVKKLLEENLDVNTRSTGCLSVLQSAVSWKHHTIAEMLLQKGADVAETSEAGRNSLMLAAANGDVTMMTLLWNYKGPTLDINAADKDGNPALHLCTQASCKEGVAFLLNRGADCYLKNTLGQTALHKAASQGDLEICDLFLKHFTAADAENGEDVTAARGVLCEDQEGRTPICEALRNQHLLVVKLLMDACSLQETLDFYVRRIQRLCSLTPADPALDIQSILGSLLLVVKSLQKDYLREMARADPINHLVQAIRLHVTSPRVLSTACLMISQLIWKDCPEDVTTQEDPQSVTEDAKNADTRDELLQQFLECRGPDVVMEKLSTNVFTAHDTYIIVSTLLPVMILAGRSAGRAWLGQNSGNLSFYKELLTRNKTFITHINLSNHLGQGLQVGQVIKTFLSFVEGVEAKDREQNLAELLEEEERDRIKREKKKRKRQKKHGKSAKAETPQPSTADVSTDDEAGHNRTWAADGCRGGDLFSQATESASDKDQVQSYFQQKQDPQPPQPFPALHGPVGREAQTVTRKAFSSEACLTAEKLPDGDAKWCPPSVAEEFPPISGGSEDRLSSDANEGWVKVENRKQSCRNMAKLAAPSAISSSAVKAQEFTRPAPMRWADVAKIGCSRDSGTRSFTVLLGDVGRSGAHDYYKLSNLHRNTDVPTSPVTETEETKERTEEDGEDWQQIARSAFVNNMSVKEPEVEQATPTPVSSDCESDEISSTASSECHSVLSSCLKNSVAEDFHLLDPPLSKPMMLKSKEFPSFSCTFSHFCDDSKEQKLFSFDDLGGFLGQKNVPEPTSTNKNHHKHDEKQDGGSPWNWVESKSSLLFSSSWCSSSRPSSSDMLGLSNLHPGECPVENIDGGLSRSRTPPLLSTRNPSRDLLGEMRIAPFTTGDVPDNQSEALFHRSTKENISDRLKPIFEGTYKHKNLYFDQGCALQQWQAGQLLQLEAEKSQWAGKESRLKPITRSLGTAAWGDLMRLENHNAAVSQQHAAQCYMPSFASMSSAVENNPIVTSVVESVLTPTVTSLSSLAVDSKPPTYSSKVTDVPSPPPGFQLQKPNPMRALSLDQTLALLTSQTSFPLRSSAGNSGAVGQESGGHKFFPLTSSSSDALSDYDPRQSDKQVLFGAPRSRSPMVGVVGPFTKIATSGEDCLATQQPRRQLFPVSAAPVFTVPSSLSTPSNSSVSRPSMAQSVFGLPTCSSQVLPGNGNAGNWSDRPTYTSSMLDRSTLLSGACAQSFSPFLSASSASPGLVDFSSILTGRAQSRPARRIPESLGGLQKRPADTPLMSYQDSVDSYQRRNAEQFLLQQQLQERQNSSCPTAAQQLYKQPKSVASSQQQKTPLNLLQQRQHQHLRLYPGQHRQISPPVLFPSDLRDEPEPRAAETQSFPAFHESSSNDLLSDLFADPLLVERIAINQIRQQFLIHQANCLMRDTAMWALRDSVYGNDMEYYASLYRIKIKDILIGTLPAEACSGDGMAGSRCDLDRHSLAASRNTYNQDCRCLSPDRDSTTERSSRRWRDAINRILDTPWTMRRQYGDIVLPNALGEYNISHVEYPLVLGLTTDGHEVAVLILDKSAAYIDPCLLEIMCDPDLDHHFILKCKGMSETCASEYVALELCDYTLAEYMQIVQLSHRQDPLSANRLAWQLLEGLKFVHHHLGMPHGNLKPSWVFVDAEGRLRLGGYGIVTRQGGQHGGSMASNVDRSEPGRSACWTSSEDLNSDHAQPSMASDIQVAGMLLYFILTGGQHPFGSTPLEAELNIARGSSKMQHISEEANDLVSGMLFPEPGARPTVEHCLKHPFFWSSEKKFRLILIAGSDVLTEMKTGIALTGNGSPTMMEILSVLDISEVSPNWVQAINPVVMKEMRSFRVYKNSLSELTLFIYNCCLHFDKMSAIAKEILDDPCKYFQNLFPSLFMATFRSLKASDRIDRPCYKPFF